VLFNGWMDNKADLARQLGCRPGDPAAIYGAAVDKWGDDADRHIVGRYCAIIDDAQSRGLRLSRSPIGAPPLHYHIGDGWIGAASVPRALLAAGVPAEIDEEHLAAHLHNAPLDRPSGWFKAIRRVQLGRVTWLSVSGEHTHQYYDLREISQVRLPDDGAYLEAAEELLDEAIRAALEDCHKPGMLLSGGLDSTIVAARMLGQLPTGAKLPSFTYVPEPDWDGIVAPRQYGDERPFVEAFAAMHPQVETHYIDNAGKDFSSHLDRMFLASGVAPVVLPLLYALDGAYAVAKEAGCDLLINAEFGNATISNDGTRAYVEYLRRGRWAELYQALANRPLDGRPLWKRFLFLSLLRALPDPAWRAAERMLRGLGPDFNENAGCLNPEWSGYSALDEEAKRRNRTYERPFYRSAADERDALASVGDADGADLIQGFEQIYGIANRDVTQYRPLFEFCLGLPTEQLMRNGQSRWLAKRMAKGLVPEQIGSNPRWGFHHADWHLRIGRRRGELAHEVQRLSSQPEIAQLVDTRRLSRLLDEWPEETSTDPRVWEGLSMAIPSGVTMARFINYVNGRNLA